VLINKNICYAELLAVY